MESLGEDMHGVVFVKVARRDLQDEEVFLAKVSEPLDVLGPDHVPLPERPAFADARLDLRNVVGQNVPHGLHHRNGLHCAPPRRRETVSLAETLSVPIAPLSPPHGIEGFFMKPSAKEKRPAPDETEDRPIVYDMTILLSKVGRRPGFPEHPIGLPA